MHAILVTVGTDGDVFPYAGLGAMLRARGHRVTLVTNEQSRALATELGLDFRALLSEEEARGPLADPDFWHPIKGGPIAARWVAPYIHRQYALLDELSSDADSVLVASPGVVSARLVQETRGRPLATLILQPGLIPSVDAPPAMPGFTLPRRAPRWAGDLYWRLVDLAGAWVVGRHLNRVRATLGLEPVRRFFPWWNSPDLIIGMFPESYGPPQGDWPTQITLTGFPMCDGRPGGDLPPEILRFCLDGDPPVAFTFGTGMMHAADQFRKALEVCRVLGKRGIFLTRYGHQLPTPLPPSVQTCEFAPFLRLFPLCAAVVHHGGIGTVAKALTTGTPQLILPMGFDQFDNAARVRRLGAGVSLRSGRWKIAQMVDALTLLMSDQSRSCCRRVAERLQGDDALETAAKLVEGLAQSPHRPSGSV
ncbi:MAG: glycosyltransferase [Isosphaeraceae bacterium]